MSTVPCLIEEKKEKKSKNWKVCLFYSRHLTNHFGFGALAIYPKASEFGKKDIIALRFCFIHGKTTPSGFSSFYHSSLNPGTDILLLLFLSMVHALLNSEYLVLSILHHPFISTSMESIVKTSYLLLLWKKRKGKGGIY